MVSEHPAETSSCDLCTHTAWAGNVVTRTLLFHIYYSYAGTAIGSRTHNHTICSVCSYCKQHICFNLTYCPREQWLEIRSICNPGKLISHTQMWLSKAQERHLAPKNSYH
jgi:hypothetical protein